MSTVSRRKFLASAGAAAALAPLASTSTSAQTPAAAPRRLRVQFTSGGHTVPLSVFTMFTDPLFADVDVTVLSHPNPFTNLNGSPGKPGPDVVVLYDWFGGGWPEASHEPWMKYLDAGKGVVSIHHALDDNNNGWPFWHKEVIGGYQNVQAEGMKTTARLKTFYQQTLTPVGNHPITRGIEPFKLGWDEIFPNMGFEPGITPILNSDDPDRRLPTAAWLGVHPKAKVVSMEPGHSPYACADVNWRRVVHNMVLWAGGRLS